MSVSIYTFKPPWKFSTAKMFLPQGAVIMIAFDGLTIKERLKLVKILLTRKRRE